jgi:hypothetical protein
MASRTGRTVAGTDGTDHLFRERVASQYQVEDLLRNIVTGSDYVLINVAEIS